MVVGSTVVSSSMKISIQAMQSNDTISFELSRTDSTNSIYPMTVTIHYTIWTTGEHV